jgi:Helix-turn-helix domain/RodZ C-terminal domain
VFEIGSSLRQARERRCLELGDIERVTRIRCRYLKALEDERFELIPGLVYAKGFLRTYADYLGLDADRFVDELRARLPAEEEDEAPLASTPVPVGRRRRIPASTPLVGLVVVIVAGVIVWVIGSTNGPKQPAAPAAATSAAQGAALGTKHVAHKRRLAPELATLVLRATNGRCWIEAHAASRTGKQLYFSTLEQGRSLRLTRKRIWIRLGAPSALSTTLNGKVVALPRTSSPVDLVVTPQGVKPT